MIHKRYFILLLTINCIAQAAESEAKDIQGAILASFELDFKNIKCHILEALSDDPNVSNPPESNQLPEAYQPILLMLLIASSNQSNISHARNVAIWQSLEQ